MYSKHRIIPSKSKLKGIKSYEGETIEMKVFRLLNDKTPITDGAPLLYTDRKDGVQPEYDIRTDKWEHGVEITGNAAKTRATKREFSNGERTFDTMNEDQQKKHIEKFPDSKFNKKIGGAK